MDQHGSNSSNDNDGEMDVVDEEEEALVALGADEEAYAAAMAAQAAVVAAEPSPPAVAVALTPPPIAAVSAPESAAASLARLRLFLAPHSPVAPARSLVHQDSSNNNNVAQKEQQLPATTHASNASDTYIAHVKEDGHAQLLVLPPASDGVKVDAAHSDALATERSVEMDSNTVDNTVDKAGDTDDLSSIPTVLEGVANVSRLSTSSSEFTRVKYLLQRCLPTDSSICDDDIAIFEVASPLDVVAQYEQLAHGLLELDSWIAPHVLNAALCNVDNERDASIDSARHATVKVTTGTIQQRSSDGASSAATASTQQLVLCKIAVGRSLAIDSEADTTQSLPSGYNSFYLQQQKQHENDDASITSSYYHAYVVPSACQILPQYLVRFRSKTADAMTATRPCALCETRIAAVQCYVCEAAICATCDEQVHSANKLVRRHRRVSLLQQPQQLQQRATRRRSSTPSPLDPTTESNDAAVDVDAVVRDTLAVNAQQPTCCRVHTTQRVEFFCAVCDAVVCVHCKMLGDHSVGDKGSHRLLTIADAYEWSVRESLKIDPLVASRQAVIASRLDALAQRKQAVLANKARVAAAIQLECAQALARLDNDVHAKVRVLDSEALEFERQQQQIAWTEDALIDVRAASSAVEFLAAWREHRAVRVELRDFPACTHGGGGSSASGSAAELVKADLELVGRLQVVSGDQIRAGSVADRPADATAAQTSSRADTLSAALTQLTLSGNDVRKKLLSMRAPSPSEVLASNAGACGTVDAAHSGERSASSSTMQLSARSMQTIAAIRHELLTKRTAPVSTTATTRGLRSPSSGSSNHISTSTATNYAAVSPASGFSSISAAWPQRTTVRGGQPASSLIRQQQQRTSHYVSDAWSTLLRQELALAHDSTADDSSGVTLSPQQQQ